MPLIFAAFRCFHPVDDFGLTIADDCAVRAGRPGSREVDRESWPRPRRGQICPPIRRKGRIFRRSSHLQPDRCSRPGGFRAPTIVVAFSAPRVGCIDENEDCFDRLLRGDFGFIPGLRLGFVEHEIVPFIAAYKSEGRKIVNIHGMNNESKSAELSFRPEHLPLHNNP
jgi:hypothetical protein